MLIPEVAIRNYREIYEACIEDDLYNLSVNKASKLLDINPNTFRGLVVNGHVPFAFGGYVHKNGERLIKINKLALINWITGGLAVRHISEEIK